MTSLAAVVHLLMFAGLCVVGYYVERDYGDIVNINKYAVRDTFLEAFVFVLAFLIAQYIDFVLSRYTQRLDIVIDTAEAASQVAFLSAVMLRGHKKRARQLVRYVHLILGIYYLTIDGGMVSAKWDLLQMRKLCNAAERQVLERVPENEAATAYLWALDIVQQLFREGVIGEEHSCTLETELSSMRRQASRQKDYHESPIPMPFFHLMSVMAHAYLVTLEWNAAIRVALGFGNGDGILVGEIIGTIVMITSVNTLRRLALAMTNPFGDDETDYELDYDLRRLWGEAQETMKQMPEDDEMERTIAPAPDDSIWQPSGSGSGGGSLGAQVKRARDACSAAEAMPSSTPAGSNAYKEHGMNGGNNGMVRFADDADTNGVYACNGGHQPELTTLYAL